MKGLKAEINRENRRLLGGIVWGHGKVVQGHAQHLITISICLFHKN